LVDFARGAQGETSIRSIRQFLWVEIRRSFGGSVSALSDFARVARERVRAAAVVVAEPAQGDPYARSALMEDAIAGSQVVRNFLVVSAKFLSLCAFVSAALAQESAPDALIRAIADDVIATIKQDSRLTESPAKVAALVEAKVLPHFDFAHTTRLAMGVNWRRATPEQQERLTQEFRTLLVRTYSTALLNYRDQTIDVKPLRARPEESSVTVRSEVRQSGAEPVSIDYDLEKTAGEWKVYDIKIAGASLAATYRDTFAEVVRNHGVDGLIEQLAGKNRDAGPRV
jgi:phospholipid transport system substrate-binding protein